MAVFGGDVLTLAEMKNRLDPDNSVAPIIEMLSRTDEVLEDIPWMEGNLLDGHKTTVRAGLPTPTWRKLNQGVAASRSTTAQVTFPTAQLAARAEADEDVVALGGNTAAARLSETQAQLQALPQGFVDALWYGDPVANPTTDIAKFPGFHYYFKDDTTGNTKDHIIDFGDNTSAMSSIWLVAWDPMVACGIYPKGSTAGLRHRDLGLQDAFDASNNRYQAWLDDYKWDCGLAVKDWRGIVRIANIDSADLISTTATQQALITALIQGINKIPAMYRSKVKIYCNSTVATALELGAYADVKAGGGITFQNIGGQMVKTFRGYPLRISNGLTITETVIS